jgi:hypothetical protein
MPQGQGPSESDIRQAHATAVGGQPKRCSKGKNCSAACIERADFCLVELPVSVSQETSRLRDSLQKAGDMTPKAPPLLAEPTKRGDTREEIYDGIVKAVKKISYPADLLRYEDEYNSWRNKAIEFNKEIIRQGLEGRVKPINVPVSWGKVYKIRKNYLKAKDSLDADRKDAIAKGDIAKLERTERKLLAMTGKLGSRLGFKPEDQASLDRFARAAYMERVATLKAKLNTLARGLNKRAYDNLENKLIKLEEWATKRFDLTLPLTVKGGAWEANKKGRESKKIDALDREIWNLQYKMKGYARDRKRSDYDKAERKLLKLEAVRKERFGSDKPLTEKGSIWNNVRHDQDRIRFIDIRDKLKREMERAATAKNRVEYDRLEKRLFKLQDSLKDKLNLPERSLFDKGDIWNRARRAADQAKFSNIRSRLLTEMIKAVGDRDRKTYDRLEERLLKLQAGLKDRLQLQDHYLVNKGDIWRQQRLNQYNKVKEDIIGRMEKAVRADDRARYDRLEERLRKLQQAGGYKAEHQFGKGEIWKDVRFDVRKEKYIEARETLLAVMKVAAINDNRNMYDRAESKLLTLKNKSADRFNDYGLRNYQRDSVWRQLYLNGDLRWMQQKLGPRVHIDGDLKGASLHSFVKGQKITLSFDQETTSFMINGQYSTDKNLPMPTKLAILKETKRLYRVLFRDIYDEGSEIYVSAYSGDGRGEKREKTYINMGFSPPDNDDSMYGRVSGGKVVPSDSYSFNALHGGGDYDDDYEDDYED